MHASVVALVYSDNNPITTTSKMSILVGLILHAPLYADHYVVKEANNL